MPVGLTSDQLVRIFFECTSARMKEFHGELGAALDGESPSLLKQMKELLVEHPEITADHLYIIYIAVTALMDTISRNNEMLAKAIPHIAKARRSGRH